VCFVEIHIHPVVEEAQVLDALVHAVVDVRFYHSIPELGPCVPGMNMMALITAHYFLHSDYTTLQYIYIYTPYHIYTPQLCTCAHRVARVRKMKDSWIVSDFGTRPVRVDVLYEYIDTHIMLSLSISNVYTHAPPLAHTVPVEHVGPVEHFVREHGVRCATE
jgi:hypothetical protein